MSVSISGFYECRSARQGLVDDGVTAAHDGNVRILCVLQQIAGSKTDGQPQANGSAIGACSLQSVPDRI